MPGPAAGVRAKGAGALRIARGDTLHVAGGVGCLCGCRRESAEGDGYADGGGCAGPFSQCAPIPAQNPRPNVTTSSLTTSRQQRSVLYTVTWCLRWWRQAGLVPYATPPKNVSA